MSVTLPLEGTVVLDFSQYMAGPLAATRLGDLGARVIKIERPAGGDAGRQLAFAGVMDDGDSLSFHIINRNKESFTADLKSEADREEVWELIAQADVIIQNFRPGIMDRLGFGYEAVAARNPRIVYASVTGFGTEGPWRDRPGQDLLAQSLSGLPWVNGSGENPPIPVGLAVADIITSIHLASAVTAALLRRERTGQGARVDTSLIEGMLDLQFEILSAHLGDPSIEVRRGARHTAHAFLPAPYGIYPTSDGYLAIAMTPVPTLARLLDLPALEEYQDESSWWTEQAVITGLLAEHLATRPTAHWLDILDAADVWCAPVLTLPQLVDSDGFRALAMTQEVTRLATDDRAPVTIRTTRAPVRFDGSPLTAGRGAPRLGEHTAAIRSELKDKRGHQ